MDDPQNVYDDKYAWIQHGMRKGWISFYCATHDGYLTAEEEELYEEYDDPCIPIYRFNPDKIQP